MGASAGSVCVGEGEGEGEGEGKAEGGGRGGGGGGEGTVGIRGQFLFSFFKVGEVTITLL